MRRVQARTARHESVVVEACDPGADVAGDCCTATCGHEATGAVCGPAGDLCAQGTCDPAGVCRVGAEAACAPADRASLACGSEGDVAVLRLRLVKGDDEGQSLGDPTAATDYAVCAYYGAGATVIDAPAPADGDCADGTCWTKRATSRRTVLSHRGGIDLRALRIERRRGTTRIVGRVLGAAPDGPLHLQIRNSDGACWAGSASGAFVD